MSFANGRLSWLSHSPGSIFRGTGLAFLGLLFWIVGCGGSGREPLPRLNIVKGQIEFTDKRINPETANLSVVQFHSKSVESDGQKVWGSIYEGEFSIITEVDGEKIPGSPEGDYVVTIRPAVPGSTVIPKKYTDPKTTDLSAHVDEGENEISFVLKP